MLRLLFWVLIFWISQIAVIGQDKIWILKNKTNRNTGQQNYNDCNRIIIGSNVRDLLYEYNFIYLHDVGKLEWKGQFTELFYYKKLDDTTELYDENWNKLTTCEFLGDTILQLHSGQNEYLIFQQVHKTILKVKAKDLTDYFYNNEFVVDYSKFNYPDRKDIDTVSFYSSKIHSEQMENQEFGEVISINGRLFLVLTEFGEKAYPIIEIKKDKFIIESYFKDTHRVEFININTK